MSSNGKSASGLPIAPPRRGGTNGQPSPSFGLVRDQWGQLIFIAPTV